MRINLISSKTIVVSLLICAFAAVSMVSGQIPAAAAVQDANYRIGPGDVIDVNVNSNSQLSRIGIRVNNQGMIQLPMLEEEIQAGCKTERELADVIKERDKKFLLNPYVIVAVKEFNSNPVAVIGAVNSPGRFQLQRPLKLIDLLTWVNGPSAKAGTTLEILRNRSLSYCDGSQMVMPSGAGDELISFNYAEAFKGGVNPYVRAGDIIRVPDATIKNAFVIGNVKNTTTTINLNEPVTLSRAIAMAGGPSAGARLEKIIIRREISGSVNRTEITANLKEINARKKDDILLQPNDIVDVPGPKVSFWTGMRDRLLPQVANLPFRVIP